MWNVEGQTRTCKLLLKDANSVDTLLEKGYQTQRAGFCLWKKEYLDLPALSPAKAVSEGS